MGKGGDTAKGAAGGAATGAAIGGPWGAAIGGVAGGLLGYFGSGDNDQNKQLAEEYRKQVAAREAPQINPSQVGQAATSGFRANQQGLINRLEAMSAGRGPSVAGEQLKMATDRNTATQQSIAQSGRGNATLANIVAANNSNNFGQGAAQQAALARISEQQMALGQLGQATSSARGMDEQTAQFNAQQTNFANQANLEAKLRTMGLNDAAILNVMNQVNGMNLQPSMGDQILAGGVGALGTWAGNRNASAAAKA